MKMLSKTLVKTLAQTTVVAALCVSAIAPANADDHLMNDAKAAVSGFVEGVLGGPKTVAPLLAPEFQIMRSDGSGYDRAGYVGRGVGLVKGKPAFALDDVVATRHGDIMVVRYMLRINEVIDGKPIRRRAPRLTVFRNIDGKWKVAAHANFGAGK